jgi:hypothetical protein
MTATADFGASFLTAFARAAGLLVLVIGAALAFVFAFAAAIVVALMILGAALALRFAPRRRDQDGAPGVLNARRTPSGWVVETSAKP